MTRVFSAFPLLVPVAEALHVLCILSTCREGLCSGIWAMHDRLRRPERACGRAALPSPAPTAILRAVMQRKMIHSGFLSFKMRFDAVLRPQRTGSWWWKPVNGARAQVTSVNESPAQPSTGGPCTSRQEAQLDQVQDLQEERDNRSRDHQGKVRALCSHGTCEHTENAISQILNKCTCVSLSCADHIALCKYANDLVRCAYR